MSDLQSRVTRYFCDLAALQRSVVATDRTGSELGFEAAVAAAIALMQSTRASGRKLMFIGNGGSAAIASHMANDYTKNGGMRALAFNDGALLTCLANDFGYDCVFEKAVEMHGQPGDLIVAISSSGRSPNILRGVAAARAGGCGALTLSGFAPDNGLRAAGDLNFYVPSDAYGYVETTHVAICQAIVDLSIAVS